MVSRVDRIVESLIEVGAQGSGKVATRGEAQNADAVGVDVPLAGMRADEPESPLRVLKRGRGLGIGPGIGDAVFEQNASDAGRVKPVAHLRALEINGKDMITASGKYHDYGAGVLARGRVERDGWLGDIAKTDERLTGYQVVLGSSRVDFRTHTRLGAGRSARPDQQSCVAGSRLPSGFLGEQAAADAEGGEKKQELAHDQDLRIQTTYEGMLAAGDKIHRSTAEHNCDLSVERLTLRGGPCSIPFLEDSH